MPWDGVRRRERITPLRRGIMVKDTENSDHARDLPIHESVLVRTNHGQVLKHARDLSKAGS